MGNISVHKDNHRHFMPINECAVNHAAYNDFADPTAEEAIKFDNYIRDQMKPRKYKCQCKSKTIADNWLQF